MARRCYSETPIDGAQVTLSGGEAHHLLHVLRAQPGMQVVLFDGSGREFAAEVSRCSRSAVDLNITDVREVDRELPFRLTLGIALPKGDRQRWIVEKSVELGVTELVPLVTERSEKLGSEKLGRYIVEASKQCGRNRLMTIAEPQRWTDWLHRPATLAGSADGDIRRWVAHPGGAALLSLDRVAVRPAMLAIGPEGGFANGEIEAARHTGWQLVGLGPRLLRIETAAVALVAALTFSQNEGVRPPA